MIDFVHHYPTLDQASIDKIKEMFKELSLEIDFNFYNDPKKEKKTQEEIIRDLILPK